MKSVPPSLFATAILCSYCNTDPSFGVNPALWNGFADKDTGHNVCWKCRDQHYKAKEKTAFKNLYSEFPIMNPLKL